MNSSWLNYGASLRTVQWWLETSTIKNTSPWDEIGCRFYIHWYRCQIYWYPGIPRIKYQRIPRIKYQRITQARNDKRLKGSLAHFTDARHISNILKTIVFPRHQYRLPIPEKHERRSRTKASDEHFLALSSDLALYNL